MRKLVAALACRNEGSRLYGKPLQHLDIENKVTILHQIVSTLRTISAIDSIVLGISEDRANLSFVDYAEEQGIGYILGDRIDVLQRLIQCVDYGQGTDAFRITTECPFLYFDAVDEAWERHMISGNDVTSIDRLPLGCHFEIYTRDALQRSHDGGTAEHRSEMCSRYVKQHMDQFQVDILPLPDPALERLDLRLTVDYPEDLVVCRAAYMHLRHLAPRIPVGEIIQFVDSRPDLKALIAPYVVKRRIWPV